ncbi:serine/threonine-protein kinase [Haliangium ochraceum]|uniref:non-specific serine/threonine protein kinase n=1 Tax=Haliangium ochraceum (strain DSM 14365 / JCM 11303 / SMP-2) TaxID=502025 RepID=D0LU84_HALO1|nr:serine/threonine protein kinase with TPR repeats [Haliangium ochraceum DSM 14365]
MTAPVGMSNNQHIQAQFPRKFGNYHLLAPLAQGGMGALYLAVKGDRGLERLLVIKTVLPHLADQEYLARFRDEAKVVVQLSHGNLIPVFDAGQVGGEVFLAMEFIEGRDLRAVWNRCAKKQVAFPLDVAVYIVKELCRGLSYAHSFRDLKLVHRDVSPPNIIISFSGEVKLTDFGLASSTLKLEKTAPGIIYGKVAYMSPEQARGEDLDGRSDIYAAAIVLWEMLTGRQLFPPGKDQPQDLIKRARNPRVPLPSQRAPRVPTTLDDICLKALCARREDRYATGDEFREALSTWLAAEHPKTDASKIETFLHDLFAEDIERERREREELLGKIRNRVQTMPPNDELRRALEQSGDIAAADVRRAPGSRGRRASDHGEQTEERRQVPDRRKGAQTSRPQLTHPGHGPMRAPSQPPPPSEGAGESNPSNALMRTKPLDANEVVGQVIDGRYSIKKLVGEGGMGRVYLAEHVEIGRRVAMKILHPVYSHMPDLVERFRREARAASRIGHPHIVDVTDSGRTREGSVYFVMEYLEGVDVGTVIEREGALDVRRALRVTTQICRALAAAHDAGIIHRDLKPENIFLTMRDGTSDFVKVLDFGIAKSTEAERNRTRRLTSPGMAMGTPEYMAPEQAAGKPADERCDVYAVGAILYEALTGEPPYEGDNFMEVLTKKAMNEPPPVREVRPEVPEQVAELVKRAMARDPEARLASMDVFEYELTKCLAGRGEAVAGILGMRTDNELVASLNPGLALPPAPAEVERKLGGRAPSPTDAVLVAPGEEVIDAALVDVAAKPASSTARPDTDAGHTTVLTPVTGRSSSSIMRWTAAGVLGLLLVGGLIYVASEEDDERARTEVPIASARGLDDDPAAEPDTAPPDDEGIEIVEMEPDEVEPDEGTPDEAETETAANGRDTSGQGNGGSETEATGSESETAQRSEGMSKAEAESLFAQAERKRLGDPNGAVQLYKQAAKHRAFRRRAYVRMAEVSFDRKDWDGAIGYAQRAGGVQADRILGNAYLRKGDVNKARRHYEAVLARNPNDTAIRALLERLN